MRLRAFAAILLASFPAVAAGPAGPELSAEARQQAIALREKAWGGTLATDWVRSLTDHVGPRPAGSPAYAAAVRWGVETMKALGLANVHSEKAVVHSWKRGAESGEIVAPWRQPLVLTALGGSVATPADGLEAEVIEASSLEDLDRKGDAARRKIVFFDKKMDRAAEGAGYGRTVDIRTNGAARAAKAGAVGVLVRSVGTDHNRLAHTGGVDYEDGVAKIPAAALSIPDAEMLERILADGKPVRARFRLTCGDAGDVEDANVVGEIPGRVHPREVVVLAAHLDSWDLGTGAIDDGAGCGIVLEAGRLIAKLSTRPGRTIRIVLYANEEHGLAGGKAYREAHLAELPLHAAALEADSGSGRPTGFSWLAGPSAEGLVGEIAKILEPLGAGELRAGGSGGADVGPMRADGVPQFSIRQDSSRYFDWHHTANDTFDKIEPESMDRMAAAVAAFAWVAASTDRPFEPIPPAQRTEEDRSRRPR